MPEPGSEESTSLMFEPGEAKSSTVQAVIYEGSKGVTGIGEDGEVSLRA